MYREVHAKHTSSMVVVLITTLMACLIAKFSFDKHLSLDGAGYFLHILENRDFINVSAGRRFAEYLTQWPLVLAVRIGINDIPLLLNVFSFGLLLPYVISFVACLYALRDGRWSMMLFPLASYIVINMTGDYLLIGEHHVMVLLSWPILLLLLTDRPLFWKEGVLLWILTVIIGQSYETVIVSHGIFLGILAYRLHRFKGNREKIIIWVTITLLLVGVIVSLTFILVPRSVFNRDSFLDSIPRNLKIKEVLYYGAFLFVFLGGWAIDTKSRLLKNAIYVIAMIPILYFAYIRFTTDYAITSYWSFSSRTLSGFLLPGMLVVAIVVWRARWVNSRLGIYVFGLATLVMIGSNLNDLSNWTNVRNQMQAILDSNSGKQFVSIDGTVLKDNHFRFSWNNPTLSLIWSYPCVQRVITNSDDANWEPFDPQKSVVLKRYLEYENSFAKIDPTVIVCKHAQ